MAKRTTTQPKDSDKFVDQTTAVVRKLTVNSGVVEVDWSDGRVFEFDTSAIPPATYGLTVMGSYYYADTGCRIDFDLIVKAP